MSSESVMDVEEAQQEKADDLLKACQQLQKKRAALGLTTEKVERQLHLQPGYIESIEQARWDKLPGPIFLRGYLTTYCKLLGIDVMQCLPVFEQSWLQHEYGDGSRQKSSAGQASEHAGGAHGGASSLQMTTDYGSPDLRWHFVFGGVGLAILLVAVFWRSLIGYWADITRIRIDGVELEAVELEAVELEAVELESIELESTQVIGTLEEVPALSDDGLHEAGPVDTELNTLTDFDFSDAATTSLLAPTPDLAAERAVVVITALPKKNTWLIGQLTGLSQDVLELNFLQEAEVEVLDSLGQTIKNERHVAGALVKLGGKAPFTVTVSHPRDIMITLNGQPVELDELTDFE